MLRLVKLTQRRLGVVVATVIYLFSQAVQRGKEEYRDCNELETGEHDGLGCLLGDLERVRTAFWAT